jgi:hypothetical protein
MKNKKGRRHFFNLSSIVIGVVMLDEESGKRLWNELIRLLHVK